MANSAAQEISVESNQPIELFTFTQSLTTTRYTSAEGNVTFDGFTYLARTIERSSFGKMTEAEQTELKLKLPTTDAIASVFVGIQPASRLDLVVTRIHETASPVTAILQFRGFATAVSFADEECTISFKPFNELFQREMPRQTYQGLCNHVHYDGRCKVLESASPNQFIGTVISQTNNGEVINIAGVGAVADNKSPLQAFKGGFVRLQDSTDFRMILDQNGDDLTLLLPFRNSVLSSTVVVQRGCDRSLATCRDKYDNVINYGGFPHVPGVNPFGQGTFLEPPSGEQPAAPPPSRFR
jgi:uncharacterized phage protein (TIGR02218 family)